MLLNHVCEFLSDLKLSRDLGFLINMFFPIPVQVGQSVASTLQSFFNHGY
jgi:hypothetical protein